VHFLRSDSEDNRRPSEIVSPVRARLHIPAWRHPCAVVSEPSWPSPGRFAEWLSRPLPQDRPAPIVEAVAGRSGFIDEAWDHFTTFGGGARVFVTPRLAIGPEVAYLSGEFDSLHASNLIVTGNVTFDFVHDDGLRRVVPDLAAGAGSLRQETLVGSGPGSTALVPFTSSGATLSAGVGARIALSSLAPEFRVGWEPESRIAVTIGIRPR
jgi:hypothetical protein